MSSMLLSLNRPISRTQVPIITRLRRRREMTSRADYCKKKQSRLPSSSRRKEIATRTLRHPILAQVLTSTSTIQTIRRSARGLLRSVKTERSQSRRVLKSESLALTHQGLRILGSPSVMKTLAQAATILRVSKQRQTLT